MTQFQYQEGKIISIVRTKVKPFKAKLSPSNAAFCIDISGMFLVFPTNLCFTAMLVYQKRNLYIAISINNVGEVPSECFVICFRRMLQDWYRLEGVRGLREKQRD